MSAQVRSNDQNMPYSRLIFMSMTIGMPTMYNLLYSMGVAAERDRVKREINSGMYSIALYILVTSLIAIPTSMVLGTVTTLFSYIWGDFHSWGSVGYTAVVTCVANYWMAAVAQFCGWTCGIQSGPSVYTLIWSVSFGRLRHPPFA